MRKSLLMLLLLMAGQAEAQDAWGPTGFARSYWAERERGWFWYEPLPPPPKPPPKKPAPPAAFGPRAEVAAFDALKRRLEALQKIAYMNPTERNVRDYLELQAKVVERSSHFADVWQRVVWATPDLDYTVTGRPVNAKALEVFEQVASRDRAERLAALARTHALFFFFRGDCPYCHQFAPYLRDFEAKFGLRIVPVSLDGGTLPDFQRPRGDNGIARTLDVRHVPALYLAEPASGRIVPVGFGVLSEAELLERLYVISDPVAERLAPGVAKQLSLQ